jgi:NAD(P) transhydrogenase subunit beta
VSYLYLLATVLFVLGIKKLSSVRTCRQGNRLSEAGMAVAVLATLAIFAGLNWYMVVLGLGLGSALGAWIAARTPTTEMPELVGALNGLGGAASACVAAADLAGSGGLGAGRALSEAGVLPALGTPATILVGTLTLTGSFVAFFKLRGRKLLHPLRGARRHALHAGLAVLAVVFGAWQVTASGPLGVGASTLLLVAVAGALGVLLVLPIGGADMPVVISLLNSYSGIAGALSGFVLGNPLLVVAGALVGTSGLILTQIMCRAMNRSLGNVLLGGIGDETVAKDAKDYGPIRAATPEEVAMLLDGVASVVMVPGYGLAVAQAQHVLRELGELLAARGAEVRYAIHPVAGRMPGHMNVLLAEADVPYDALFEMDKINPDFGTTDVAIVVGANDVVNPAARTDPSSPIAGMPILDVDRARTVVVIKRSLAPGYAGIKNPLFEMPNCMLVFLDAKEALAGIVSELKQAR